MECLELQLKLEKQYLGFDIVLDGIKRKQVKLVIVANDASEKTMKEIMFVCEKFNVPLIIFGNIDENSRAIGKKNRASIGIKDKGFANVIQKIINGGEA